MRFLLSYPLGVVYGLYFYILFQLVFLLRFGRLNMAFNPLDISLIVVGVVSVLFCQYLAKRLPRRQSYMAIPFLFALPFAAVGALVGGLFGFVGILVVGLLPFAILLPLGYWFLDAVSAPKDTVPPLVR